MPGSTRRSATADEVSPTPSPSPSQGRGEEAPTLAGSLPLSAPERGLGGEVRARQPALLPAIAAPTTTLRPRRRALARVSGVAWAAGLLLALIVGAAILAPLLAPHSPYSQELLARLSPPAWLPGGSSERPLGADDLGRDVLSRLLYGSRVSL